jgi:hypothetical protein
MAKAKKQDYEYHKLASIFPRMESKQYKPFADDIAKHGLREPICLFEGKILDGRHRYEAMKVAKREFDELDFTELDEGTDPIDYIKSHNLYHRHLTESQRGMVAAKLASLNQLGSNQHTAKGPSIEEASKAVNVSKATTERAKTVLDKGVPKLVEMVEQGKIKASVAQKIADKTKEDQETLVAKPLVDILKALSKRNEIDAYDEIEKKLIKQLANVPLSDRVAVASKTVTSLQNVIADLQKKAA